MSDEDERESTKPGGVGVGGETKTTETHPQIANLIDILTDEASTPTLTPTPNLASIAPILSSPSNQQLPFPPNPTAVINPLQPSPTPSPLKPVHTNDTPHTLPNLILNEFDPLSPNSQPIEQKTAPNQKLMNATMANLISFNSPRPFQLPAMNTNTQFRAPNYNITLPTVRTAPVIPQSQSFQSFRQPSPNPAFYSTPRPFYLTSNQTFHQFEQNRMMNTMSNQPLNAMPGSAVPAHTRNNAISSQSSASLSSNLFPNPLDFQPNNNNKN